MNRNKLKTKRANIICQRGRLHSRKAALARSLRSARKAETIEVLREKSDKLDARISNLNNRLATL